MKKYLGIDLGDAWSGIAISDALGIVARPYKTVASAMLIQELETILSQEPIGTIIIGYPKTLKGLESEQTKKVISEKEKLEKEFSNKFPNLSWILWDERLSSKRASTIKTEQGKKIKTKEEKLKNHAIAAAFILDSYLTFRTLSHEE
jgi:putative holliday junction resolvase